MQRQRKLCIGIHYSNVPLTVWPHRTIYRCASKHMTLRSRVHCYPWPKIKVNLSSHDSCISPLPTIALQSPLGHRAHLDIQTEDRKLLTFLRATGTNEEYFAKNIPVSQSTNNSADWFTYALNPVSSESQFTGAYTASWRFDAFRSWLQKCSGSNLLTITKPV